MSLRNKIFREAISNLLIYREFSDPFPVTNQDINQGTNQDINQDINQDTNQDINQDNSEINKLLEVCKTP